ncbi:FliH/SctL family protein [Motilibacter deserti]|uniref:Flagellar assembly protein FliH n=1 Tax=Motilibacter deserti TaxID=2714956 RepID=A0ABX0H2L5_9ACTN|nr:FliH/SctL family protein [Motilibacter deserti]NHC16025.1 flagellar assembly protein FliH [Motilibacter deserti]
MSSSTEAFSAGLAPAGTAPAVAATAGLAVLRGGAAAAVRTARLTESLSARPQSVEEAREAARSAGYAAGWAAGSQAAMAQVRAEAAHAAAVEASRVADREARFARAFTALEQAASDLERRAAAPAGEAAEAIAEAAFALAEAIVGRELATAAEPGVDAVRRALSMAPAGRPVTVWLSPEDAATLDGAALPFLDREITIVPDAGLMSGDAYAESDATSVDARIAPALARAKEILRP